MDNTPILFSPPAGNPTKPRRAAPKAEAVDWEERLLTLEMEYKHQCERVEKMDETIVTLKEALFGTKDAPEGIFFKIQRMEGYMNDLKKIGFAIFLALLGVFVGQMYYILTSHPMP